MLITMGIAREVAKLLRERSWTLGTAESCTGGLIAHWITNLPGSSEFFVGGVVAYANEVKRDILGVPDKLLAAHGAVSREVALAMARGIRRVLGTDVSVGVTGIAGPTGGTPKKPVGTVFVAVSSPLGDEVSHHLLACDRLGNKVRSAELALELLREQLRR